MAPVPTVQKKKPRQAGPLTVSTDNVVDNYGRTLTTLQRRQRRIDEEQTENTIGGDDGLEARIAALEEAVGIPYTGTDTLDERVTDLEGQ